MSSIVSSGGARLTLAALLCVACASSAAPAAAPTYRFADVPRSWEGPIWVEFLPGDELPVWMTVDGAAVEPLNHAAKVRVNRRFYLLYDRDGISLSYDKHELVEPAANVSVLLGESADHGRGLGFRLTVPPHDAL
jgi:uncharacterized protein YcfL